MKKYYITQYIAVAQYVEADSASEAVKKFSDDITAVYLDGNAPGLGLSFGDSGEKATVEQYFPIQNVYANVGSISAGEFVPAKAYAHA